MSQDEARLWLLMIAVAVVSAAVFIGVLWLAMR